jgi:hypothetical protein
MATQWTAGLTDNTALPAATLNQIGAAWESYTPTFVNLVNSSLSSKYTQINKLIIWQIALIASSSSSGIITATLPVTAASASFAAGRNNFLMFYDASATDSYVMSTQFPTSTTARFYFANSTSPTIWDGLQVGVSDELSGTIIYEAA